ncbi:hypothetical protein [uncultured Psychroserpens sp.]|uniref:hypothetical protein n=1 Tax=uncultured Psychroserpens sp. TaxID=255436 RepID=UPI002630C7FB|nr:hypothetical protein [uncultured Psychroserpens sp.]
MKKLLIPIFCVVLTACAQQNNTIDLKWNISDTLTYKTVMKDMIVSKEEIEKDTDTTFGRKASDFLKKMQEQTANLEYITKLFPDKKSNIDIAMMVKENKSDTTETLFSGMARMNGNVVLRGKLSPEGEILSFYYKSAQTNLISILFELPKAPVKVGDQWSIKMDFIAMDQNFIADTLNKKNNVRLEEIKDLGNDKVAVIKYDIKEYVSGYFGNGLLTMFNADSDERTFMKMTYEATGLFSIKKGIWIDYEGFMEVDSNFSMFGMGGTKRTQFKLTPEDN